MLSDWCFNASVNILNPMYVLAQQRSQRSEHSLTEGSTFRAAAARSELANRIARTCALGVEGRPILKNMSGTWFHVQMWPR